MWSVLRFFRANVFDPYWSRRDGDIKPLTKSLRGAAPSFRAARSQRLTLTAPAYRGTPRWRKRRVRAASRASSSCAVTSASS